MSKEFLVYQICFNPPPYVNGNYEPFDTLEQAETYVKSTHPFKAHAWIILKKSSTSSSDHEYELVKVMPIN